MTRNLILPAAISLIFSTSPVQAVTVLGVESLGFFQPKGTLLRYDSGSPGSGVVVGQTGLLDVGAIDFFQGRLWAASANGNVLSFWQINPATAQATLISTAGTLISDGYPLGGSFDDQGRFWVANLLLGTLSSYNPSSGQRLSEIYTPVDLRIPGIAFIGSDLYALASSGLNGQFGTLDTKTGEFRPIASGIPRVSSGGLDYDPASGKLYSTRSSGGPGPASLLQEIDPKTGQFTTTSLDPHATMDAIAVVPEPAGLLLLVLAASIARPPSTPHSVRRAGRKDRRG